MKQILATITVAVTLVASSASAFDPEHLKRLEDTNECTGCNLSGVSLEGKTFIGANLRSAKLSGSNLKSTVLQDANLEGADLTEAVLTDAQLKRAKLYRA